MDTQDSRIATPFHGPRMPRESDEYCALRRSLGKEVRTSSLLALDKGQWGEVSFILSEMTGEATFFFKNEKTHEITIGSEADLPGNADLVRQIKYAQSDALRAFGNLSDLDYLFSVGQVSFDEDHDQDYDLNRSAKVEDSFDYSTRSRYNFLKDIKRDGNNPYLFFAKSDIQSRAGLDNLEGIVGFEDEIERKLLMEPVLYREFQQSYSPSTLYSRDSQQPYPIDLWNLPVLAWAPIKNQALAPHGMGNESYNDLIVTRNFRWELSFLGSDDILGSAAWNDFEGIQGLAERMLDRDALKTQQTLMDPGFFTWPQSSHK